MLERSSNVRYCQPTASVPSLPVVALMPSYLREPPSARCEGATLEHFQCMMLPAYRFRPRSVPFSYLCAHSLRGGRKSSIPVVCHQTNPQQTAQNRRSHQLGLNEDKLRIHFSSNTTSQASGCITMVFSRTVFMKCLTPLSRRSCHAQTDFHK